MDILSGTFNLALIILGFGLLIFVHEAGHFLAAKWAGIRTEVFAVGMGTPVVAWRKGIGWVLGSTHRKVLKKTGKGASELSDEELARRGIGETEYSLRWLPIGGFVKMLGQDDLDPSAATKRLRSYNVCPVGKRMVVISAGVIANIILAVALFVVAFMIGVRAERPVVGDIIPTMPAAGVVEPGDRVLAINDRAVRTFADIDIYVAMAKPDEPLSFEIDRAGQPEPLHVELVPQKDPATGLLGIGVTRGRSTTLLDDDEQGNLSGILAKAGLDGVRPGMTLVQAAGQSAETYAQFHAAAAASQGEPVPTVWRDEEGNEVSVEMPVRPMFQTDLRYPEEVPQVGQGTESGLLGLVPLVKIGIVSEGSNDEVLAPGDVLLRVGPIDGPTMFDLRSVLAERRGGSVEILVRRDGQDLPLEATVDRKGRLNITIEYAWELPQIARPLTKVRGLQDDEVRPTPVADLMLRGRTRIERVGKIPVTDWATLREGLRLQTRDALEAGRGAEVPMTVAHPTPGEPREVVSLVLSADDVRALHDLGWTSILSYVSPTGWGGTLFAPMATTLSAGGNPIRAMTMGFAETWKFLVMTYLTIDRLVRGSVGVEQIRGPVGIVHIGKKVADRGFTYLIFFLGIISVNLAVINFLPLPIVDGGLFLFLIYEKLKGRPPSLAFQNAATILGLALIATVLLVVTWNDVVRLVSGGV